MRKLEVVHKEVGGCLISYNLQQGSWRLYSSELEHHESLSQSVTYVGTKLLWQLKSVFVQNSQQSGRQLIFTIKDSAKEMSGRETTKKESTFL